jgi:hypothetical protein
MIFICSVIEPGHPCVTISGNAFSCFRTDVNEMNVQSVDLGDELRQGVQFCLDLAPVILCRPIARQRLHRRELHSLVASVTVSRSGHFVALMRLRNSVSSVSGTFT